MKVLLITVAGTSSRFRESLGRECLKCIYYEKSYEESLLYRMIRRNTEFDCYIIVGGFRYEELVGFVNRFMKEIRDRIVLVENPFYEQYGSGYSLFVGMKEAIRIDCDELVFAEGDLYVDSAGFDRVCGIRNNVITYNRESILASKAVAFYFDERQGLHYIYDTGHSALHIGEPFLGIFNSGQIWKFYEKGRMVAAFHAIRESEWRGTNLVYIQEYFGRLTDQEYEMVEFSTWINCNTVSDFRNIKE